MTDEYIEPKTVIDTNTYQLLADFGQAVSEQRCQDCGRRMIDAVHVKEAGLPRLICEHCRPIPRGQRFVPGAMPLSTWLATKLLPGAKEEFLGKWKAFLVKPAE